MVSEFFRCSLGINSNAPYRDFRPEFLSSPGMFQDSGLREILHEILHFWQSISLSFLTDLASFEYEELVYYYTNKKIRDNFKSTQFYKKRKKYLEKGKNFNFSPYNLAEALARFWDIHIYGPLTLLEADHEKFGWTKEEAKKNANSDKYSYSFRGKRAYKSTAFDLLMQADPIYAEPYKYMLNEYGSLKSVIVFPIAGYFALQTSDPVDKFSKLSKFLCEGNPTLNNVIASAETPDEQTIHYFWPRMFFMAWAFASNRGESGLTPGWNAISDNINNKGIFIRNAPYAFYNTVFKLVRTLLKDQDPGKFMVLPEGITGTSGNEEEEFNYFLILSYFFTFPGEPYVRRFLLDFFPPPLILFSDRRHWNGHYSLKNKVFEAFPDINGHIVPSDKLVEHCSAITEEYMKFRRILPR